MDTSGKKDIIFGVNGYIGRHLALSLLEAGREVHGFDVQDECMVSGIVYRSFNATDAAQWRDLDLDCGTLYWMCGLTGTGASFEKYDNFLAVNELALLRLLDTLRSGTVRPRIVFPSTRLVYRGSPDKLREDAPKEGKTIYAVNKIASEKYLEAYWNAFEIPFSVLRICVPYGSRFGAAFSYGTMGMFYRQATELHKITLWGDGGQRRTFTHVVDICRQLIAVAESPKCVGEVFNSGGEDFSLCEIAEMFAVKYGAEIAHVPFPEMAERLESGSTVFDSGKLESHVSIQLVTHKIVDFFM